MSGSIVFAGLAALAMGVYAGGPRLLALLAYERSSILGGEVWRLLTTHLVHAGIGHLVWNLGATGLVWVAVARELRPRVWLAVAVGVALASSAAVLLLRPDVRVMAGLSALLHGLLAAGATASIRRGERLAWLLVGVLAAKIAWEQLLGPTPFGAAVSGRVAVDAHAFGTLAGLLAGFVVPTSARAASGAPATSGRDVS